MSTGQSYDTIAERYRDSMRLPFRRAIGRRHPLSDHQPRWPGTFEVDNYYLEPATYDSAMRDSGFGEFRWIDAALDPSERQDPIWDEFLAQLL